MLVEQILTEKPVVSSWIADVAYNRTTKVARMTLGNGRKYDIEGISRREFDKWHGAGSKGKFWHFYVKGFYSVKRVA